MKNWISLILVDDQNGNSGHDVVIHGGRRGSRGKAHDEVSRSIRLGRYRMGKLSEFTASPTWDRRTHPVSASLVHSGTAAEHT